MRPGSSLLHLEGSQKRSRLGTMCGPPHGGWVEWTLPTLVSMPCGTGRVSVPGFEVQEQVFKDIFHGSSRSTAVANILQLFR